MLICFPVGVRRCSLQKSSARVKPVRECYHRRSPFSLTVSVPTVQLCQARGAVMSSDPSAFKSLFWRGSPWHTRSEVGVPDQPDNDVVPAIQCPRRLRGQSSPFWHLELTGRSCVFSQFAVMGLTLVVGGRNQWSGRSASRVSAPGRHPSQI